MFPIKNMFRGHARGNIKGGLEELIGITKQR